MKFNKLNQGDTGNYLKLKDGESAIGVPRGEIFSFKSVWVGGRSTVVDEPNPANHNRFKINFIVKGDAGYQVRVWEFGITIYNMLADLASEMEITKSKLKVTRRGSTKDNTSYTIIPLGAIDGKSLEIISVMDLNILDKAPSKKNEGHKEPHDTGPGWPDEASAPPEDNFSDEIPF